MYTQQCGWTLQTKCCLKKARNRIKSTAQYRLCKLKYLYTEGRCVFLGTHKDMMSTILMWLPHSWEDWGSERGSNKISQDLCGEEQWWEGATENDWLKSAPGAQTKRKIKTRITLEMILATWGRHSCLPGQEEGGIWGRNLAVVIMFCFLKR